MFAYIGPGAGFAFLSSLLALITSGLVAFLALALWPFRKVWRILTRPKRGQSFARRLIVVGFDGQDPVAIERGLSEDGLPNHKRVADAGGHRRFRAAPNPGVAWPSFWEVLGKYGVWTTVLCAPAALPLRKFHGAQLVSISGSDPEKPQAFVSQPSFYVRYLAKRLDKATTSELAGRVSREQMFFAALNRLGQGALVCVFDRAQPAENDRLIGGLLGSARPDDVVVVLAGENLASGGGGLVLSNRAIDLTEPALPDIAPTALRTFGIEPPPHMTGAGLFAFGPSGQKASATH